MSTKGEQTSQRKLDHVRINLDETVGSRLTPGFEAYRFRHRALPELDLDAVELAVRFLDCSVRSPLLISSMTGGAGSLEEINVRLAEAAQERGIAMGVGSQRAALESEGAAHSFQVRSVAPDVPIFANLGAVQLNYGYGLAACQRAVDMVEANALILHLNALQEAVQPEGDTRWSGILDRIAVLAQSLSVPIIAKEVGWGIHEDDARRLRDAGVAAIDVAGAGGTSWSEVERHRAQTSLGRAVAAAFIGWGIPTAQSLVEVRSAVPEIPLIASGGIRDGIDVAKAVALGASLCGLASPFLRAAAKSTAAVIEEIDILNHTLRIAMFAVGARDLSLLRDTPALERVST